MDPNRPITSPTSAMIPPVKNTSTTLCDGTTAGDAATSSATRTPPTRSPWTRAPTTTRAARSAAAAPTATATSSCGAAAPAARGPARPRAREASGHRSRAAGPCPRAPSRRAPCPAPARRHPARASLRSRSACRVTGIGARFNQGPG